MISKLAKFDSEVSPQSHWCHLNRNAYAVGGEGFNRHWRITPG